MKKELNDLFDYENLKIYQPKDGFKFSLDSILLAEYVKSFNKCNNILDLCTGNAVVPLILSTKTSAHIDCIEIQKEIYDLAVLSIQYNHKESQITVYNDSIINIDNFLKRKKYDIITCNPPYFRVSENSNISIKESEAIARHEILLTLEDIFKISSQHLDDKGELYLVHRAERLDEIIIYANKYNLGVKDIQLIKTKEIEKPSIVLIRCVKNSKYGIKISNTICIEKVKTYQNLFKEVK